MPVHKKENAAKHYIKHKEKIDKINRDYYYKNKPRIRKREKEKTLKARSVGLCTRCFRKPSVSGGYCGECRAYGIKIRRKFRLLALEHYGGKCACCGETNIKFLTIDHINNDGFKWRKDHGNDNIGYWLARHAYPEGYQILCFNCNCGRQFNQENPGICPHREVEIS